MRNHKTSLWRADTEVPWPRLEVTYGKALPHVWFSLISLGRICQNSDIPFEGEGDFQFKKKKGRTGELRTKVRDAEDGKVTQEKKGWSLEGRWLPPPSPRMGMEGQAQELGGEGWKEAHVLVFEVSLESLFPPLSLTFLKDYQPAIAQGSPKRIVSDCNYQLGNVFKT